MAGPAILIAPLFGSAFVKNFAAGLGAALAADAIIRLIYGSNDQSNLCGCCCGDLTGGLSQPLSDSLTDAPPPQTLVCIPLDPALLPGLVADLRAAAELLAAIRLAPPESASPRQAPAESQVSSMIDDSLGLLDAMATGMALGPKGALLMGALYVGSIVARELSVRGLGPDWSAEMTPEQRQRADEAEQGAISGPWPQPPRGTPGLSRLRERLPLVWPFGPDRERAEPDAIGGLSPAPSVPTIPPSLDDVPRLNLDLLLLPPQDRSRIIVPVPPRPFVDPILIPSGAPLGEGGAPPEVEVTVNGRLDIHIDAEGRPTVRRLDSSHPDIEFAVDRGIMMGGP